MLPQLMHEVDSCIDVTFDASGDAGDAEEEDGADDDGAGFEDDPESSYPYPGYEPEGDTMMDPSTVAVAGSSGVDGSKGRFADAAARNLLRNKLDRSFGFHPYAV
jgi:hypothetical protein